MVLNIAVPSKGRLTEQALDWLGSSGSEVRYSAKGRNYSGTLTGTVEGELVFLSAAEIPCELAAGTVHFGITGIDVMRENLPKWRTEVREVARLGFGKADLAISVPKIWLDAETIDDLDAIAAQFRRNHGRRLRIATKFRFLVREFLCDVGITDYQLIFSQGATEGTVANNFAEAIADLVSTGRTLDANGLKRLKDGTVLQSEAALFQSKSVQLSGHSATHAARLVEKAKTTGGH